MKVYRQFTPPGLSAPHVLGGIYCRHMYEQVMKHAGRVYEALLASGVAPEDAAMVLPRGVYEVPDSSEGRNNE